MYYSIGTVTSIIFFLNNKNSGMDSVPVYIKFVGYNLEDPHRHHIGTPALQ